MANISSNVVEERTREFGKLWMIDDLIRERGRDKEQVPILGYPRYNNSAAEYEYFTGKDLDRMVDDACRKLVRAGLEVNSHRTVALFAPSDLSFIVTFFALFRLGCKALTMSIRLNQPACLHLLDQAKCDVILHGATVRINSVIAGIRDARPGLTLIPMLDRADFDRPGDLVEPFHRPIANKEAEHVQIALIAHSSGSTGLPKPLVLSHRSLLASTVSGTGLKAFNALPWYHLHGLITSMQAMWMRRPAHLFNAHLPLTADNLISALKSIQPEICHTVPYTLKLNGREARRNRRFKEVQIRNLGRGQNSRRAWKSSGSGGRKTRSYLWLVLIPPPETSGWVMRLNQLISRTEVGHIGDSIQREPNDDSWDYIRPYANLREHMVFKKLDEGAYELVYLGSHPALTTSNSNEPPGSFHSGDIFTPHPAMEWAWKYVARADDRVTLLSGEKILPLGMEGTIRESPLVRDALMVGNDRLVPGLLIFRSTAADNLSDDQFLEAIEPLIDRANGIADEFARLTPDMIVLLAADIEYPATDKNNIIRAAAYSRFADIIESLYNKDGKITNGKKTQKLRLNIEQLEEYILRLIRDQGGIEVSDTGADLFAAGIDSLRAAQVRRLLQRDLDLGGRSLRTNVVYDAGSVTKLARLLFEMRVGNDPDNTDQKDEDEVSEMQQIIDDYSKFRPWTPGKLPMPERDIVVLTGATGSLGAHLLSQLLDNPRVERVFCLVRGNDALARINESMKARGLDAVDNNTIRAGRLVALTTYNLGAPNLGLSPENYSDLQRSVTLVLHVAWPVNFNISLTSLIPHVAGLHNLVELSLRVPFSKPARLMFASSISTAFKTQTPARVPEGPIASLRHAAATGYARSKLIGERICSAAAACGGAIGVLRIGQISADTVNGIWNDKEAIPILVRSATEIHALPRLEGDHDICDWMPVDTVARACLQLAEKPSTGMGEPLFYNVRPPHKFSWNQEFLPALRKAGLDFEEVSLGEWMAKLYSRTEALGTAAEAKLPAAKLAGYYETTYDGLGVGSGPGLGYDIQKACNDSSALRLCPNILDACLVPKMLRHWVKPL